MSSRVVRAAAGSEGGRGRDRRLNFFAPGTGIFTQDIIAEANRNQKLRDVAAEVLRNLTRGEVRTHFEA